MGVRIMVGRTLTTRKRRKKLRATKELRATKALKAG
jgi:hypothetical protein